MAGSNQLKISDTTYDLNDVRVSSGTAAPSGGVNGDIYFQKGYTVSESNGWYYVVYDNNMCECWKLKNLGTLNFTASWGPHYAIDNAAPGETFPVTFATPPSVCVDFWSAGGNAVFRYTGATLVTTTQMGASSLAALNSGSSSGYYEFIHVIGVKA